jgi:hypothetical protein
VPDFRTGRGCDFAEDFGTCRDGAPSEDFHVLLKESGFNLCALVAVIPRQKQNRHAEWAALVE